MTNLKMDFVDGDILTAGTMSSTSGVNGMTWAINNRFKFISYSDGKTITNTTNEVTAVSSTIAANTVSSAIAIIAGIDVQCTGGAGHTATFSLKVGTVGAEVLKKTQYLSATETVTDATFGGAIVYFDSAETWTSQQNVIITVTDSGASADNKSSIRGMLVVGY